MKNESIKTLLPWIFCIVLSLALMFTIVRGAADIGYWREMLLSPEPESCVRCELGNISGYTDSEGNVAAELLCLNCRAELLK